MLPRFAHSASPASGGVAEPDPANAGGSSSYIHFALHIKCMAEGVGCAHPLRSFRLPSVAEPDPANAGGSSSYTHFALRIKCMAEGVGFEPTSRFTGSGFQDRRLKPLGHPSTLNSSWEFLVRSSE